MDIPVLMPKVTLAPVTLSKPFDLHLRGLFVSSSASLWLVRLLRTALAVAIYVGWRHALEASANFLQTTEKIPISLQRCLNTMGYSVGWMIEGHFGEALKRSDNCDANTWSRDVINYILQHLGYDIANPELQVYWLLPEKDILDGMVCLDNEEAIASMARAGRENRSLHVIVDERNHVKSKWDDLIYRGCPELPRVMTPRKMPSGFRRGEGTSGSTSSRMVLVNEAATHSFVHPEHEEEADKGHGEAAEDEHGKREREQRMIM